MNARVPALTILLIGLATPGAAQEPAPSALTSTLVPADRVRVRTTSMSIPSRGLVVTSGSAVTVVGVVDSVDAAVLTVIPRDRNAVRIPAASIAAVDVSVGRKRNWLWGLVSGVSVGLAAGISAPVDPQNCGPASENFCSRGVAIGGTALAGAALGAALGALIKSDRWERRFPQGDRARTR